jgi:hypothetical protein
MKTRVCVSHRLNISGNRYGKLTAISDVGKNKHGKRLWRVQCDCGNEKTIVVSSLVNGHSKSCGYCSAQKRWTKTEEQLLRNKREHCTDAELAIILKRAVRSVQAKCRGLGIKASEEVRREAIRITKIGTKNPNWKGAECGQRSGGGRARTLYRGNSPCAVCGSPKTERHHKDGNTLNNLPSNISFLCRKHHMDTDGRLEEMIQRNKRRFSYVSNI